MEQAIQKARKLMRSYFAKMGKENPEDSANRLLDRIRISNSEPFISKKHDAAIVSILANAHFDVDDLVENFLNITLHIESLHELDAEAGSQVLGCARPKAREITICVRALEYEPLYRGTVMHETGHIVLDGSGKEAFNYSPNSKRRPAYEKQADRFMVHTLLPDSVLLLAILFCARVRGINLQHAFWLADSKGKGYFQWKHIFLPRITKWLGVSRQMVSIKLHRLGFFSRRTLYYHCPDLNDAPGSPFEITTTPLSKSIQGIVETACNAAERLVEK